MKPLMKCNLAVAVFNAIGVWTTSLINYDLYQERQRLQNTTKN